MGWLDALERRGREAIGAEPKPKPAAVSHTPRLIPKLEYVWIQTAPPRDGDAGAAAMGCYTVEDGVLTMRDESGKSLGTHHTLVEGDNPKMIAGRLRRAAWLSASGESNFNRPLNYPRVGVA